MAPTITAEEFEALFGATARDVFAYVRRRTAGDSDNLVAEVYAVAWRRRAALPAAELRRAWLFGVARTLLKAEGRRQLRDRELVGELATLQPPAAGHREATTAATIATALERLSRNDREILQLATWECLEPAELAVVLGVRPGTARVRLHRARRALAADPDVRALVEEAAGLDKLDHRGSAHRGAAPR